MCIKEEEQTFAPHSHASIFPFFSLLITIVGRIHVHDPKALGQEILHKYFRHSKYSSFQRQLNYFGFRKTQGKGKMSACTYTNFELTNASLKSLLKIKRKTNTSSRNGMDDLYDPDSKGKSSFISPLPLRL